MFGIQVQNSLKQSVLSCPYCRHKFRALQGLIAHKHKHERAGDNILPKAKLSAHSYAIVQIHYHQQVYTAVIIKELD